MKLQRRHDILVSCTTRKRKTNPIFPIEGDGDILIPGSQTTRRSKLFMIQLMKQALDTGSIQIHRNLVTRHMPTRKDAIQQFITQMKGYMMTLMLKKVRYQTDELFVTKFSGKHQGGKDDMVMSTMAVLLAYHCAKYNPLYSHFTFE